MFGIPVIVYLFLGGCGAGTLLVASLWSIVFYRDTDRSHLQTEAFLSVKSKCLLAGFVILCLSAVCLMMDLGRPEKFFYLFTRPTASILTFGSFTLLANLVVGGFLTIANLLYIPWVSVMAKKVAEVLCVVLSFLVMAYTGMYLQSLDAVALWTTVLLPVLFMLSSLSAGLAMVFLIAPFVRDCSMLEDRIQHLHVVHLGVLVLEVLALVAFVATTAFKQTASESLSLLFVPDLGLWFVGGVLVLGLVVPLLAELASTLMQKTLRLLPVDLLCLFGGFCLRYCIVSAGLH